jgi:group I intron endonuclease
MDRKEKINAYKEAVQPMGVYQIRNIVNGKILIGSSKDLKGILNRHKFQLKNNLHTNKDIQNDFTKFGEVNFRFEILDYLEPGEDNEANYTNDLEILENMWLEKLKPFNEKGYNKVKR